MHLCFEMNKVPGVSAMASCRLSTPDFAFLVGEVLEFCMTTMECFVVVRRGFLF